MTSGNTLAAALVRRVGCLDEELHRFRADDGGSYDGAFDGEHGARASEVVVPALGQLNQEEGSQRGKAGDRPCVDAGASRADRAGEIKQQTPKYLL